MEPELLRLVTASSLQKGENVFEIETSVEERARVAKRLDLIALNHLSASLRLVVESDGGAVDVDGAFTAETVQPCAVTLDPLVCQVTGTLSVRYAYDAEANPLGLMDADDEAAEDPPEPIIDGVFDLGEALTQALSLEIEPYPRAPDLPYNASDNDEAEEGGSEPVANDGGARPFAGLAALKNKLAENR